MHINLKCTHSALAADSDAANIKLPRPITVVFIILLIATAFGVAGGIWS